MHIFLSHSAIDQPLAEALRDLLNGIFGNRVEISFSTDRKAEGGVAPGAHWHQWIMQKIEQSDRTYVLLTPNSLGRPWVLWESGAAAGAALTAKRGQNVIPVSFGLRRSDIPDPFQNIQCVQADAQDPRDGVLRLLQQVNLELGTMFPSSRLEKNPEVKSFIDRASASLQIPAGSLLEGIPNLFPTDKIGGLWVTCFKFGQRHHVDISEITPEMEGRSFRAYNKQPEPRTEGHELNPFFNEIEGRLINRHVIGHWRNLRDDAYFGTVHLAVLRGEKIMDGVFTSYTDDIRVGKGRWRWVRLAEKRNGLDLNQWRLEEPSEIYRDLMARSKHDPPLMLGDVATKWGLQ
ncbi:toll/interleukin-1 receptor domain-containing protein [Streptomyces sp. NBC_00645]|uniref:toll/interleukin-1 receptor domain-containing protein n=1 Tax=Streptomyces sp. NBC_00645 TaxID=2975795 RepID=UPI00324E3D78